MQIKIKKGLDLPLAGAPDASRTAPVLSVSELALSPDDYTGLTPKVDVKPGQKVAAGLALWHAKEDDALCVVSPCCGTVTDVVRGERRKVLRVVIKPEKSEKSDNAAKASIAMPAQAAEAAELLARNGLLAMMRQRPYDTVPASKVLPRDIFVTSFDSAPLAYTPVYGDAEMKYLEAAVKLLGVITPGAVYIGRRSSAHMPDVPGAEMVDIAGPHPAGLAGTLIDAIKPVNKGETVWTLSADTLYKIGTLLLDGRVDWTCRVSVCGPCVAHPCVVEALPGTPVEVLLQAAGGTVDNGRNLRYISGNVLTGARVEAAGFLHWPYTQLTVIAEGDDVDEFMGWASLAPSRMSSSPSYPGSWFKRLFRPDARVRGGRRAMIQSGIYDSMIPLDIMPEYLIKAINAGDIENMERLGIYEVAPEDFALAEYADSSKQPLQNIVRKGLEMMRRENG